MVSIYDYKIYIRKWMPKKMQLQIAYFKKHRRFPNIRKPKTLNEKILWSMLYGYKPFHTMLADKYLVRKYIKEHLGERYLIPLIKVYDSENDFDINELPDSFIIKCNNGSGNNQIVRDKYKLDIDKTRSNIRRWLNTNPYYTCKQKQYKDIVPKIIIEKLLLDSNGRVPNDYKFHCINGKVEFIQVDEGRYDDHRRSYFYRNWEICPFTWCPLDESKSPLKKIKYISMPHKLEEMIYISEKLAANIKLGYVRIDLYSHDGSIRFGEITLHHGGGMEIFVPNIYDIYYGNMCNI